MELLGADIDIAGQDIVGDDVLDKGSLVVLFLVIGLRAVERHIGHDANALGNFILAVHKDGIVKIRAPADQGFHGSLVHNHHGIRGTVETDHRLGPFFSNHGGFAAGYDIAVGINDADGAVSGFLHLDDHALKHAAGHECALPLFIENDAIYTNLYCHNTSCSRFFQEGIDNCLEIRRLFLCYFSSFSSLALNTGKSLRKKAATSCLCNITRRALHCFQHHLLHRPQRQFSQGESPKSYAL